MGNEEHTSTTSSKTTSSEKFMLSNKNRLSVKAIGTVVLATCLCLVLVVSSWYPCRTFRRKGFKKNAQKNTMKQNNLAMRIRKDSSLMAFGLLSCSPESNSTKGPFDTKDPVPQSSRDEKTFDPTMLTGADDIHVERLARLESSIKGMREFLVRHLPRRSSNGKITRAAAFLAKAREYLRVMEADVAAIRKTDRAVRKSAEKMRRLRNYVRNTIERLQNPTDCKSAPKLRCLLDNPSGLAAGAHDVLWCFVAALRMGRTLILDSTRWHYAPGDGGWTGVLQPVTGPSCNGAGSENMIVDGYPGYNSVLKERSQILDLPSSITKDLLANHGDPYAWWYGQIMAYVFRLQNSTRELIEDFKMNHDYKHPIVALHIRRTDKKREAAFHDVAEYMQHAEEFYSSLALRAQPVQKRVFVSTDDPKVITEIIRKFPAYKVICNHLAALEAFDLQTRVNNSTLANVLIDIYLLAESDYLVCAFSSGLLRDANLGNLYSATQFCRVAYELMQARYAETGADATHKAVSVDIEYFYAFVPFPPRRTLYCNKRVFHNELEWTAPGVLIERPDEFMPVREAKEKRYADGFNTGRRVGSRVDYNRMMFPRFKTVRTYSVAQYGAFNESRA